MKRQFVGELMDRPDADPRDLARALRFLRVINRWTGGVGALVGFLERERRRGAIPRGGPVSLLDIGTGSGDIPLAARQWARRHGIELRVTGVDNHPGTLAHARRLIDGAGDDGAGVDLVQLDARDLLARFGELAFDYVHAGLFVHHLPDDDARNVLAGMARLARIGWVWNDLVRSRLTMALVWAATRPADAMARHDGPASVRAAFTVEEALALAFEAGWPNVEYRRHWVYRFSLCSVRTG